jgi:membrane dipeptidase
MAFEPIIVDAHEDLAWNMLTFGRDYALPAIETRRLEQYTPIPSYNGDTLLGWADYQAGHVALVFGTLFASPRRLIPGNWDVESYDGAEEAHHVYWKQVEQYRRFVDRYPDRFRLVEDRASLQIILSHWIQPLPGEEYPSSNNKKNPVGVVMLMEGAEGVRSPGELETWWGAGVRIIGPAWAGTRFCGGTHEPGPMTSEGWGLLEGMQELGFVLDISHMDEKATLQVLDRYSRRIIASHANAKALIKDVDTNRHLSNQVIEQLVERGGIIGVIPHNVFLNAGWQASDGKQVISLDMVAAQIDFICQIAGDAHHVGLGSDFDGGFGYQATPAEINTVADLQKLVPLLQQKGYNDQDIRDIFGQNWLSLLSETLP